MALGSLNIFRLLQFFLLLQVVTSAPSTPESSLESAIKERLPRQQLPDPPSRSAQPASPPGVVDTSLPRLTADIVPSGTTNVTITLHNRNPQNLLILPWRSFLTRGSQSQALRLYDINGRILEPGPLEAHTPQVMVPTSANNYTLIQPGQTISRDIDLTQIFSVPEENDYTLQVQPFVTGGFESDASNITAFYRSTVWIDALNVTLHLTASAPAPDPSRDRLLLESSGDNIVNCSPEERQVVVDAVNGATQMARWARNPVSGTERDAWDVEPTKELLWGDFKYNDRIFQVYEAIGAYNISERPAAAGLSWVCDRDGSFDHSRCQDGAWVAYAVDRGNGPGIFLCEPFFGLASQAQWVPSWLLWSEQVTDQQATALHEMTHVLQLTGLPLIIDVPDEYWYSKYYLGWGFFNELCYTYSCAVGLAARPWGNYTPLLNANNWEIYAAIVRNCRFLGGCR
ncbi:MAG: hypothetical protein M1817_000308 [Caeruleum heppii]|nr:MAG: hypothetical protein M1817_000308 [Caeruleum heppii]